MRLIDADAIKLYYGGLVHIPYNDFIGIANYFMNQIKEMPTVTPEPHWIPVTERLPEEDGTYIVCLDDGSVFEYDYISTWWEDGAWEYCGKDVIAWMHLPEPYEGGNDV